MIWCVIVAIFMTFISQVSGAGNNLYVFMGALSGASIGNFIRIMAKPDFVLGSTGAVIKARIFWSGGIQIVGAMFGSHFIPRLLYSDSWTRWLWMVLITVITVSLSLINMEDN